MNGLTPERVADRGPSQTQRRQRLHLTRISGDVRFGRRRPPWRRRGKAGPKAGERTAQAFPFTLLGLFCLGPARRSGPTRAYVRQLRVRCRLRRRRLQLGRCGDPIGPIPTKQAFPRERRARRSRLRGYATAGQGVPLHTFVLYWSPADLPSICWRPACGPDGRRRYRLSVPSPFSTSATRFP